MFERIKRYFRYSYYAYYLVAMSRVNMALGRAAATSVLRTVDDTDPLSWEFCGFSQSGGDGIVDMLTRKLLKPNRYCIEIGANDGVENNTAWLAFARRYTALMIDGNPRLSWRCKYITNGICLVDTLCMFVGKDNIGAIKEKALYLDPDFFSIDIDGVDYYVAEAMLKAGFRPKIIAAEYNSSFGPSKSFAIEYRDNIYTEREAGRFPNNYFGCSVTAWKTLFGKYGYKFLTVDTHGVDAFFINPEEFDPEFVKHLKPGLAFEENYSSSWYYRNTWEQQFDLIKDLPLLEVK